MMVIFLLAILVLLISASSATAKVVLIRATAVELVKFYESSLKPSLTARWDSYGRCWEIGYGCTRYENGTAVKQGDIITMQRAEQLRAFYINDAERTIKKLVKVKLTKGQTEALKSFIYNFGETKFKSSQLLTELNKGNYQRAANEFPKWVNGVSPKTGKMERLAGLISRREDERKLFLS